MAYIQKMSNLGRRELGAGEKALKYEFSLEILRVRVEVPLPCKLKFMWKRNSKGIETKVPCEVLTKGSVDLGVNEKVSSISTIIYDTERKEFQGKDSELIVQMYISNSPKKLASCQVDMKSILDPLNVRTPRTRLFELPLAMSVSLPAKTDNLITFRLTSQFKEEIIPSERSLGGGTLNTSGLSIQDNKYFERRHEVIPSKDSYSVTSYNTGIRYPSASKRERDDSSSIRKYDYGFLAGLKSNVSQEDKQPRTNDNKTDHEPTSLPRQLVEEQNRRSKAEAELAKNHVEITELKKRLNELHIDNIQLREHLAKREEELRREDVRREEARREEVRREDASLQYRVYELGNEVREARAQQERAEAELQRVRAICDKRLEEERRSQEQAREEERSSSQQREETQRELLQREQAHRQQLQKEVEECTRRLENYENEKVFLQREVIRFRQEAERTRPDPAQLEEKCRTMAALEAGSARLQQRVGEVEAERNLLREAKARLEEERAALQREVERAAERGREAQGGAEMDRLFRESLQMEVELKFAKDELARLRAIEDTYEEARWRADKEANERAALEKDCEAIERELVGKNRALMIEVEKTKMMAEQLNEAQLALAYLREEAERSRNIIYAREQDSARLSQHAETTANALANAQRELADLRAERERLQADSEEVRLLQNKVAELERRNTEKLSSLEAINSSLLAANAQTRELQQLAEERQRKAREAEGRAGEAEGRAREAEGRAREAEGELGRAVQERKMLEKRNEMIMEEIHGMKKRFEEEKGRSLSVTRHEEFSRLRTLESELEKRDKNISKLSKEKLELEEENVRINVQVMKLLSELEKAKAHSAPLRPK